MLCTTYLRTCKRIVPLMAIKQSESHATSLHVGKTSARIAHHLHVHHDRAGLLELTNLPELDLVPNSGQHLVILRELAQVTVARTGKHIKDNGHGQTDACDQNHRC